MFLSILLRAILWFAYRNHGLGNGSAYQRVSGLACDTVLNTRETGDSLLRAKQSLGSSSWGPSFHALTNQDKTKHRDQLKPQHGSRRDLDLEMMILSRWCEEREPPCRLYAPKQHITPNRQYHTPDLNGAHSLGKKTSFVSGNFLRFQCLKCKLIPFLFQMDLPP